MSLPPGWFQFRGYCCIASCTGRSCPWLWQQKKWCCLLTSWDTRRQSKGNSSSIQISPFILFIQCRIPTLGPIQCFLVTASETLPKVLQSCTGHFFIHQADNQDQPSSQVKTWKLLQSKPMMSLTIKCEHRHPQRNGGSESWNDESSLFKKRVKTCLWVCLNSTLTSSSEKLCEKTPD